MSNHSVTLAAACLAVGLLSGGPALADGFRFPEQSAKATGMAGAFAGVADDPSAIYYNPAGLPWLEPGIYLQGGGTFVIPMFNYQKLGGGDARDTVRRGVFPPNLYAAYVFDNRKMAIGLGVFMPFGLALDWGSRDVNLWNGRYSAVSVALTTFNINPNFAWRPVPQLSLSAGVSAIVGFVELKQQRLFFDPPNDDGTAHLGATAASFAANASLMWKPNDELSVGLTYRSHSNLFFSGDVDFTIPSTVPPATAANFPDQTAKTKITLPNQISLGTSYKVTKQLALSLDFNVTFWRVFDEVKLEFSNIGGSKATTTFPQQWVENFTVRLGAAWDASKKWQLRAGALWDSTPVPDDTLAPLLPDQSRLGFSLGFGFKHENFSVDWAFMALVFTPRKATSTNTLRDTDSVPGGPFTQKYVNQAYLSAISVGYKF